MKQKKISIYFLFVFTCILINFSFGQLDKSDLKKAYRVLEIIDFLEDEKLNPSPLEERRLTITESEFNAYIAYRIWEENEQVMKTLQLKFFENNKIEGRVFFDLKQLNPPSYLKQEMTILFSGRLRIRQGKGKLELYELYLENRPVQTNLFNAVLYFISKVQGAEFFGLSDWYELPHGIKNIKLEKGKAVIFY